VHPRRRTRAREKRYFRSRGPAQLDDFTWWSGLTTSDARIGLESIRGSLISDLYAGRTFFHWNERAGISKPKKMGHLLPAFDEYLVAYRNREAVLDPKHAKRANAGGGMLNPTVLIDGRVIGTWRRELSQTAVVIEMNLFERPASTDRRAILQAAKRLVRYLGMKTWDARITTPRSGSKSIA
jgi:hypothetical protein